MEVIPTIPKPTIKEVTDNKPLQTNPLLYDGPVLMPADGKDFDNEEMTIQGLTKEDEDNDFEELDISNLRSYLEKDDEKDEEEEEEQVWVRATRSISQELAQRREKEKPKIEVTLPKIFSKYRSVFKKKPSECLPTRKPCDHAMDLKPDFVPWDCKVYPITPEEQKRLEEFINENRCKGYIHPSKSPNASPYFFVAKKDSNQLRPCQNYHHLNDATIKNTYPLPQVGDLLDKLKGAKRFTKLDLRWRYNNVWIKEGNKWKAAFKTNLGLFEPLVMYFRLCNSPSTFQNMMNDIL
jgi:hypothetical protein